MNLLGECYYERSPDVGSAPSQAASLELRAGLSWSHLQLSEASPGKRRDPEKSTLIRRNGHYTRLYVW